MSEETDNIAAMQEIFGVNFMDSLQSQLKDIGPAIAACRKVPWTREGFRAIGPKHVLCGAEENWSYVKLPNGQKVERRWTQFRLGGKIAAPTKKIVVDKLALAAWKSSARLLRKHLYLEEEPDFRHEVNVKRPRVWNIKDCKFYRYDYS